MQYSKFTIKNYKGIKELTFDMSSRVDCRVFTLVGLNESGKTTLLEALIYWYETFLKSDDALHSVNIDDPRSLIPRSAQYNFNESVEISGKIEVTRTDFINLNKRLAAHGYTSVLSRNRSEITYEIKYNFISSDLTRQHPERLIDSNIYVRKTRGTKIYDLSPSLGSDIWLTFTEWLRDSAPQIIYYPNFLFDFPDKIYLDKQESDDKIQKFYYRFIQDLLDSIDNGLTIETSILNRAKNLDQHNRRALEGTIARLGSVMNNLMIDLNVFQFQIDDRKINLSFPQLELDTLRFYTQFTIKEREDTYDIKERSLGFRWFFTFILLTQFRLTDLKINLQFFFWMSLLPICIKLHKADC